MKKLSPNANKSRAKNSAKTKNSTTTKPTRTKTTIGRRVDREESAVEPPQVEPSPAESSPAESLSVEELIASKKRAFLEALARQLGLVTTARKAANVSREEYEAWLRDDRDFARKTAAVEEIALDFVEGKALEAIQRGNARLIQFYLQKKGRARGYGDEPKVDASAREIAILSQEELEF